MKKSVLVFSMMAIVTFMIYNLSGLVDASKGDLVLTAKKVKSPPADAGAPQWERAKDANIVLTGAGSVEGKELTLKAKAVYTNDEIFFRFEWPDKTKSMNKNSWKFTGGKWVKQPGDEDRLGVVWEINRVNKFATKGCAVFCHNQSKDEEDWYYAVDSPTEKADLWHWKSVRSNPVGFTEDGYVRDNPEKKPEAGRKRDAGNKPYKATSNRTKDKSAPAYMQDPTKAPSVPGSLLAAEAVPIKSFSGFKDGDRIPGYLLHTGWKGSFGDIKTQGLWKEGKWTVMMRRKLRTDNDDDVQFNTRRRYPFAIAVFDNAHEQNSYNSEPLKIQFK